MTWDAAEKVANAVLYEGYVLYPYRASAAKNQFRWQFGVVAPVGCSEPSAMTTELIVELRKTGSVQVRVRFLQVQSRTLLDAGGTPVPTLEVDGELWTSFDEAVEHTIDAGVGVTDIDLPGARAVESLGTGSVVRQRWPITGQVTVTLEPIPGPYPLRRLIVTVTNAGEFSGAREDMIRRSLVAVHTLAAAADGRFISMLDPPEFAKAAVASCHSEGTFPVLITDDVVLSSPIVLYDHPAIAPESGGDMFDATEIDEILALRVLTLTDDEKREARATDPRSAAIIDRIEAMTPEGFGGLHGTFRAVDERWWEPEVDASFNPFSDTVMVGDREVGAGTRVKLRPSRRSDAQDIFVTGRVAEVAGVFHDVGGDVYLAVVLEDDPGADLHQWHGRYLYFNTDEVSVQ